METLLLPRPAAPSQRPLMKTLRSTMITGVVIVVVFFFGIGGWAAVAPLAKAVVASGLVAPDNSRQTVQHLEGGIIRELRVRDGDVVKEGDVLLVLQSIKASGDHGIILTRLRTQLVKQARLLAERANEDRIRLIDPLVTDVEDPEIKKIIEAQAQQFKSRRANHLSTLAILAQRIEQHAKQIGGYERQLESVKEQRRLIELELADVRTLVEKQLAPRPRLLALQRTQADLLGDQGNLEANVAQTEEAISETKMRMKTLEVQRLEQIDTDLAETQEQISELEQQLAQSEDILTRTDVRAPVDGVVIDSHFKTPGGVIQPGEPILDIVPSEDVLIIDAKVGLTDVDDVHPGLPARVMFPSYSVRNARQIKGKVLSVSADVLQDKYTGKHYFQTKIEVDRDHLKEVAPEIQLQSGLPAEVFITTGERTVLKFFLDPFLQSLRRAFSAT